MQESLRVGIPSATNIELFASESLITPQRDIEITWFAGRMRTKNRENQTVPDCMVFAVDVVISRGEGME
jgi:hypothetical protein